MIGFDRRVCAVAFGFRRLGIDEESGDQPAHDDYRNNQSQAMRSNHLMERLSPALEAGGLVARKVNQEKLVAHAQHPGKEQGGKVSHDSHQNAVGKKSRLAFIRQGFPPSAQLNN